ncbi:MAG: D-alanyl-D-alanine carboxypeptidase [Lachnospiraceae bacterium]|nr:D-alanyl-D-alanine carboxypeptidase [Lachnospiraceae bacterium]
MKRTVLFIILSGILLLSACGKKEEIAGTEFYREDVIGPMTSGVGVNGRIAPVSEGLAVILSEDIYDPDYVAVPTSLLIRENTHDVLYSKGALNKIYPASMTKCMTALLAIEYFGDLDTPVTAGDEVYEGISDSSSLAGITPGMTFTVKDLLTALLLPSGNDAANVLAAAVSGSVTEFVALMNARAKELGMINTRFANPNGLHDANHYTTAYDLYLLMRACMEKQAFREAAGLSEGSITGNLPDGSQTTLSFKSTNSYARGFTIPPEGVRYLYSKTGYTEQAGRCIISVFEDTKKNTYIAVSAGAKTYDELYLETNALLAIIGQD